MTPAPAPEAPPSRLLVLLSFAAIYVIWGSTYLAIKWVVASAPPFLAAAARFLLAGGLLMAWSTARGAAWPTRREWTGAAIVGVLLLLGGNGGVMWAGKRVPSGLSSVLIATIPVFMVVLEALLGTATRASSRTKLGVGVGLAGVVFLMAPTLASQGGADAIDRGGALALLSSALLWTLGSLLARRVALPKAAASTSGAEMLTGGAALLVFGLMAGEGSKLDLSAVTTRAWLAWGYLVVFGSIVAFSAYSWLLSVVAATRVGTYAFVNPVVALLLGVLVADEALSGHTIAACLVIVAGVVLTITGKAVPPPPVTEPAPEAVPAASQVTS